MGPNPDDPAHPAPPVEPGSEIEGDGTLTATDNSRAKYISDCKGVLDNPHYGKGTSAYPNTVVSKGVVNCPSAKPSVKSWTYLYRYRYYGQEQLASGYKGTQDSNHNAFARAEYKCRKSTNDFSTEYTYRNWAYGEVKGWNGKTYRGGQESTNRGVCTEASLN